MNAMTASKSGAVEPVRASFRDKLVWLTRFGKPRLVVIDEGWHASIEMHVASVGASFTVRSEFDMSTPEAAIDQCIQRMLDSLAKLTA